LLEPADEVMRLHTFELVIYLDAEGRQQMDWQWRGEDITLMQAIGFIEAAKLGLYHAQTHPDEE